MGEYVCGGCNKRTKDAVQCRNCKLILCSHCGWHGTCKDNSNGKAGCGGRLEKLP